MRIGIDVSMLVYSGSGVATYTYELVKHLLEIDKNNEYRLFYSSRRKPPRALEQLIEFEMLGAKVYRYPLPPWFLKIIWNRYQVLPVEWLIGKVDVYHSSDFLRPPLLPGTRGITTIHDLTWKIYPQYHTPVIVEGHKRKLKRTINGNDQIIVDSQNTNKDLRKYYPQITDEKIKVIPLGVSERFHKIKDKELKNQVLRKYQIPLNTPFLLYVGAIEPRKRLDLAVKALAELVKDDKYADYMLVIAGRAGWKNEELFKLINSLGVKEKVIFPGYIEDEDLPALYSSAKLFVYLSDYEGFGLPPLEAQACGCPILISFSSSLAELFKYESNFVKSADKVAVVRGIKSFINQSSDKLEDRIENRIRYNWAYTAKHTLEAIENYDRKN